MKGDKVYVFIEEYTYDYEKETRVTLFEKKEDAYKALENTKECECKSSWINRYNEEDLEIGADGYDEFDIYLNGYASQYETHLFVIEKEIH